MVRPDQPAGRPKYRNATGFLFIKNVFNTHVQLESLYAENLASAGFHQIVTNQPLTAGIHLSYKF